MDLYLIVAAAVLLVLVVILFVMMAAQKKRMSALEYKYNRFMRGKDVENMEEVILSRFSEMGALKKSTKAVGESLSSIDEMGQLSFQKMGIVKYDAFDDMGGNLSFVLAILTKQDDGFVLNSVHGREGCYTYLKEIVKGNSYIILSPEEEEALAKAKNMDNFME